MQELEIRAVIGAAFSNCANGAIWHWRLNFGRFAGCYKKERYEEDEEKLVRRIHYKRQAQLYAHLCTFLALIGWLNTKL